MFHVPPGDGALRCRCEPLPRVRACARQADPAYPRERSTESAATPRGSGAPQAKIAAARGARKAVAWGACRRLDVDVRLLRDHLFETLKIRHQRRLVHHAHVADDRRALFNGARIVRPHDIRAHAHELREALRDDPEITALEARADAMEDHDAAAS